MRDVPDAGSRYVAHLLAATPQPLAGLRVVVDCAYGAASAVAPDCYARAGAEVVALHADPDGPQHQRRGGLDPPRPAASAVRAHGADLGIAHDGDADRCLAVDADGREVDGDQIMAVLALAMHEAGELVDDTLVATVMSNLGLHLAMRETASRCGPPRSATGTSWRTCGPADTPSAASSPGTSSSPRTRRRATGC